MGFFKKSNSKAQSAQSTTGAVSSGGGATALGKLQRAKPLPKSEERKSESVEYESVWARMLMAADKPLPPLPREASRGQGLAIGQKEFYAAFCDI
jgi:hypothetical protein